MNNRRGFTLLISVLIFSAILLLFALSATRGLSGQLSDTLALQDYLQAKTMAESCAERALLELRQDDTYVGNETITIGLDSCDILPVSGSTTVQTESTVNGRVYRLQVELSDLSPITISDWRRVSDF